MSRKVLLESLTILGDNSNNLSNKKHKHLFSYGLKQFIGTGPSECNICGITQDEFMDNMCHTRRNIIALSDEIFMETREGKFLNNIILSIDDRSSDDFHIAWRLYDEDDSTRIDHEIMKKLLVIKHLYFEECECENED